MFNNYYLNTISNIDLQFIIKTKSELALWSTGRFHSGPVSVKAAINVAVAEVFNYKFNCHI